MKKVFVFTMIAALALFSYGAGSLRADESVGSVASDELSVLKTQVQELLKRIEVLEAEQTKTKQDAAAAKDEVAKIKETTQAAQASRVDLEKIASKLKIKGRWAAGYFHSEKAGSFPGGSWEAPEAKIQFGFQPDEINNVIMRFNLNNATFNNLDYFYLDTNLEKFFKLPIPLMSRIGRMKLDLGEETWSNNPVESVLPSNSAANLAGSDEGLQLSGKLLEKKLGWSMAVSNGNSGIGSDTGSAKAFTGKLSYQVLEPLYASLSYHMSNDLKSSAAEVGIAGLTSAPASGTTPAAKWDREVVSFDLRYDFQKGKTLNPPAFSDSKAILRLNLGRFSDDTSGTTTGLSTAERSGMFGFAEGTYNLNPKLYLAYRYSIVDLDGDNTATLNSIAGVSKYQRHSLGFGYRLTSATILKVGYDWNSEYSGEGATVEDANNNLLSAIVAMQF